MEEMEKVVETVEDVLETKNEVSEAIQDVSETDIPDLPSTVDYSDNGPWKGIAIGLGIVGGAALTAFGIKKGYKAIKRKIEEKKAKKAASETVEKPEEADGKEVEDTEYRELKTTSKKEKTE